MDPLSPAREFKAFLVKQNIIGLAIAVVVGVALNSLVKAVVDDFIMPFVGVLVPAGDWQKAVWKLGPVSLGVGNFLSVLLNFLIVGFVAWRISLMFIKPEPVKPSKDCPFCRMTMDPAATRCPHCTSQVA